MGGAGCLLALVGLLVMVGSLVESVPLVQLRADWAPMQFNAAVCFLLLGGALLAARAGFASVRILLGTVLAVFAFAVFVQYLFPINLGIDEFFTKNWVYQAYVPPGRIPGVVAALFFAAGAGLAVGGRLPAVLFAAGVVIAANGFLFALGYLPPLRAAAAWSGVALVSLHTALGLVVGGVAMAALVFRRWESMTPALLFLMLAFAGVNLWNVLVRVELHRVGEETAEAASSLAQHLQTTQSQHARALERMARRLEVRPAMVASGEWRQDAEYYLADIPGMLAIAVHGSDGVVVPAVARGSGHAVTPAPEVLARAFRSGRTVKTQSLIVVPLALPAGHPPMAVVASVGYSEILSATLTDFLPGFVIAVSIDGALLYERVPGALPPRGTPIASFAVPGEFTQGQWSARVWPEHRAIEGHRGPLPLTVLVLSLLAAVLSAVLSRSSLKLRTQVAYDRTVWTHSQDILCAVDADGRFVRVSDSVRSVLGYEPSELVGRSHLTVSVPEERQAASAIVADKRRVEHYVSRALHKDGSQFPMSWTAVWSDDLQLMIAVGRDIREQVEHESELERRVAERTHDLTLANAELEAFSYSVSHDLRTPLRAIAGFTEVLIEELPPEQLSESAQLVLNRVLEGTDRMARVIDDLLRLGQLSRRDVEKRPVDLSAVAEGVVARLRALEPTRNVEIRVHPGIVAQADVSLIELVLENLFGNAWKFTVGESPAVIEFSEEGGVFRLADNGVGFDMEYAGSLFGVFQRLHGIHEYSGTGIGLATVKRIIERHGGEVWANAEVGKGATFYFTLG